MKVSMTFTLVSMRILAGLFALLVIFSIVDQLEYGFGQPLYFIIPMTAGAIALAYGLWNLKKWSVYLYAILAGVVLVQDWMDFGVIYLDSQLFTILIISGLLFVNRDNLK